MEILACYAINSFIYGIFHSMKRVLFYRCIAASLLLICFSMASLSLYEPREPGEDTVMANYINAIGTLGYENLKYNINLYSAEYYLQKARRVFHSESCFLIFCLILLTIVGSPKVCRTCPISSASHMSPPWPHQWKAVSER